MTPTSFLRPTSRIPPLSIKTCFSLSIILRSIISKSSKERTLTWMFRIRSLLSSTCPPTNKEITINLMWIAFSKQTLSFRKLTDSATLCPIVKASTRLSCSFQTAEKCGLAVNNKSSFREMNASQFSLFRVDTCAILDKFSQTVKWAKWLTYQTLRSRMSVAPTRPTTTLIKTIRICRCSFIPTLTSIVYSMKFQTALSQTLIKMKWANIMHRYFWTKECSQFII